MKISVTLTTWFNWCVRIYRPLRFNRLMWIDRSVWLIWVWFVWPLGLYGSCATPLLTSSSVIKSVVISTTSSVHKLQTAAFSHVIVPAWVVSCARSSISWQCTWIWNKLTFGIPHTMANILRLWRCFWNALRFWAVNTIQGHFHTLQQYSM